MAMRSRVRGCGIAIVAATATVAIALTGVLRTGALTARAAPDGPAQARSGANAAASARAAGREVVSTVTDLLTPRVGFIGLGDSPNSLKGRAELVRTTNFGRTFTNIGPRTAKETEPDSIFFLDRAHGWFATYSVATLRETVYRTSDRGRTWQAFAAPGHAQAAGSGDSVQFVSPTVGWLVDTQPTAPAEDLYSTTDGGATWHLVASAEPAGHGGPGTLPELGRIEFEPNGTTGWLGGGMFSHALYRTTDGGLNWHRVRLPVPVNALPGTPTVVGQDVIEPVTVVGHGTAGLRIYTSSDGGTTWSLFSSLPAAASRPCPGPLPTSIPNQRVAWVAAYRHHRVVVFWANDLGMPWVRMITPAPAITGLCGPDSIAGRAGAFAWLVTPGRPASPTQVWATTHEGRSWYRIDLAAREAR